MEHPIKAGISTAVAAGLALVSAQASAADFDVGGSVGKATFETSDNVDVDGLVFDLDFESNDTAFKLFGGYMFNDYPSASNSPTTISVTCPTGSGSPHWASTAANTSRSTGN